MLQDQQTECADCHRQSDQEAGMDDSRCMLKVAGKFHADAIVIFKAG
jgi:hypothetical protein